MNLEFSERNPVQLLEVAMRQFTDYGSDFRPGSLEAGTLVMVPYGGAYANGRVRLFGQDADLNHWYFVELSLVPISLWFPAKKIMHVIAAAAAQSERSEG